MNGQISQSINWQGQARSCIVCGYMIPQGEVVCDSCRSINGRNKEKTMRIYVIDKLENMGHTDDPNRYRVWPQGCRTGPIYYKSETDMCADFKYPATLVVGDGINEGKAQLIDVSYKAGDFVERFVDGRQDEDDPHQMLEHQQRAETVTQLRNLNDGVAALVTAIENLQNSLRS